MCLATSIAIQECMRPVDCTLEVSETGILAVQRQSSVYPSLESYNEDIDTLYAERSWQVELLKGILMRTK